MYSTSYNTAHELPALIGLFLPFCLLTILPYLISDKKFKCLVVVLVVDVSVPEVGIRMVATM